MSVLWVVAAILLQRLLELWYAARNTRRLRDRGAVEHGAGHYPLFVLLHGTWLASLLLLVPWDRPGDPPLLLAYLALQPLRLWVILSLGPFWTTRVLVAPGTRPVRRGPYRWLRHPNYAVVAIEIPLLPLAYGAREAALVFGGLNLALLAWRIRVEERALAPLRRAALR